jgi:hypothetical protein
MKGSGLQDLLDLLCELFTDTFDLAYLFRVHLSKGSVLTGDLLSCPVICPNFERIFPTDLQKLTHEMKELCHPSVGIVHEYSLFRFLFNQLPSPQPTVFSKLICLGNEH